MFTYQQWSLYMGSQQKMTFESPSQMLSYQRRPISMISAVAKGVVYTQLSTYLSEHNILSKYQYDFGPCILL